MFGLYTQISPISRKLAHKLLRTEAYLYVQGQHGNRKLGIPELRMNNNPLPTQGPFQWSHSLGPGSSKLITIEYEQAPTSKEQTLILITALCQYSLQHQFEYVIGQDHEEFLFIGENTNKIDRSSFPKLLDDRTPKGSEGLTLDKASNAQKSSSSCATALQT